MTIREALKERRLLLDGAMGSLIHEYKLTEDDFRGYRFRTSSVMLKGNMDVLVMTRPDVVSDIHRRYLEAGADLITTCTFSSQRVSQQEYHLTDYVKELNREGVRLARREVERMMEIDPSRQCYVLGDVGPTSRMLSMSEDVTDPAARAITFDELEAAFREQIAVLVDEGVDAILLETIFDTLNAKAAIAAYNNVMATVERDVPLMISLTISDNSGRLLSGQTVEAFVTSIAYAKPLSVGMNCGFGAEGMLPFLRQLKQARDNQGLDFYISCHPNAGLPNNMGEYDETPEMMLNHVRPMIEEGIADIIGGCCGTTPAHINMLKTLAPPPTPPLEERGGATLSNMERPTTGQIPPLSSRGGAGGGALTLSGLESFAFPNIVGVTSPLSLGEGQGGGAFIIVGERCNVAGSRKFLRLINEKNYDEALDIARKQVERGAMVIDINMDDGLLDAKEEMRTFVNLIASDPSVCRVPLMIDSSRFDVIETGLKCFQGKCIVNSISLKQGEQEFLRQARIVKSLGAAVIVMCFDEQGQATNHDRRVEICQRAYRLLVDKVGFNPTDIIFDPNVLTIATGMAEHANYARDFITATRWIRENLPGARISGGLSNLSFAFRGNNYLRECMHSVFLHHAIEAGMGMAIMNPATAVKYEDIPEDLREAITAVILNTSEDAVEMLTALAPPPNPSPKERGGHTLTQRTSSGEVTSPLSLGEGQGGGASIIAALISGSSTNLQRDIEALLAQGETPLSIISGPLMDGMNEVGARFGRGEMFLPQVIKTARTMKQAVEILQPYMQKPEAPDPEAPPPAPPLEERGGICFVDGEASILERVSSPLSLGEGQGGGAILIATVKGDVHDIGKNIVSVVLQCNGFNVIDLGVMVPAEKIVEEAIRNKVDIVCLSGLITPSLDEMCHVAEQMQAAGLTIPLFVGGATTSLTHTAMKISQLYEGGVFHVRDAAQDPVLAMSLLDPQQRDGVMEKNRQEQQRVRLAQQQKAARREAEVRRSGVDPEEAALAKRYTCDWSQYKQVEPPFHGQRIHEDIPVRKLMGYIDWTYFYWAWRVKADTEEGRLLRADADKLLAELAADDRYYARAITAFYPAEGTDNSIISPTPNPSPLERGGDTLDYDKVVEIPTPRQRLITTDGKQRERCLALCDFIPPYEAKHTSFSSPRGGREGALGLFAATVCDAFVARLESLKAEGSDDYAAILLQTIGDRLAEAASEMLAAELNTIGWGGIRPAVGYPSLPDQNTMFRLAELIDLPSIGISLTENGAMYPQSSVAGLYIQHPEAQYFTL